VNHTSCWQLAASCWQQSLLIEVLSRNVEDKAIKVTAENVLHYGIHGVHGTTSLGESVMLPSQLPSAGQPPLETSQFESLQTLDRQDTVCQTVALEVTATWTDSRTLSWQKACPTDPAVNFCKAPPAACIPVPYKCSLLSLRQCTTRANPSGIIAALQHWHAAVLHRARVERSTQPF
jgi:hypothetical protein